MIAFFDWDNTLRYGYTMSSWLDYLYKLDIADISLINQFNNYMQEYRIKRLSHDQFAEKFCLEYCDYFKGYSVDIFEKIANEYISNDFQYIHKFTEPLFEFLSIYKIEVYVITGAPQIVINKYKDIFNITKVLGFDPDVDNKGILTGKVKNNYGYNKKSIIQEIINKRHDKIIGFGDSESDLPFLENSDIVFIVGNNSFLFSTLKMNSLYNINGGDDFEKIRPILLNLLSN